MCITTSVRFTTCEHTYLSRASRCMPSQLSHGKFCEGHGVSGMKVAGLCPGCGEWSVGTEVGGVDGGSETETTSSSGTSTADTEACAGVGIVGEGEKKEIPGPGSYLEDIPGFEIREVEKWKLSAWGLGRGVGMGMGSGEGRRPRKLQKARKVPSVKRVKERFVLDEEEMGMGN